MAIDNNAENLKRSLFIGAALFQILIGGALVAISGSKVLGGVFFLVLALTAGWFLLWQKGGQPGGGEVVASSEPKKPVAFINRLELDKAAHHVLVDDDFLIRMGWESEAAKEGYSLSTFDSAESLKASLASIPKDSVIFSDCDLGQGQRGESLCQDLSQMGYKKLYLETGYNGDDFVDMPFIKGVVSKTPPFSPEA